MTRIERRAVLVGGALLACGLTALRVRPEAPSRSSPNLESMIAAQIGAWSISDAHGIVLPPADQLTQRIYSSLLARRYSASGRPDVSLVIAYGAAQDYALQLHRPEVCYSASGYRVHSFASRELPLPGANVPASTLIATRGARSDLVLFWTRIGLHFPQTTWGVRRIIATSALTGALPDGVLIRFSTSADWLADPIDRLVDFASALIASLRPDARRLLLGGAQG